MRKRIGNAKENIFFRHTKGSQITDGKNERGKKKIPGISSVKAYIYQNVELKLTLKYLVELRASFLLFTGYPNS